MSFPIGRLWARYVPNATILGLELNPGPFTAKEHVIITIMGSVASNYAYSVSRLSVQPFEYAHDSTTYRPILLPPKRSSTTRVRALHVSCRRSEIQEIGLSLSHYRPMASGDVDATDRLLDRWCLQAFPCRSPVNDLA